jgi:short-subunit dehydrogenase
MDLHDYEVAMQTNFWAQLYAMLAAIPYFLLQGEGRIVNITSIGGKIAVPHLLPYTASKFATVGLSEGMHAELKQHNIHVTTIVPNLMRTGSAIHAEIKGDHEKEYAWFKHTNSNPLLAQDPDVAAETIISAIEYNESEVILSLSGKVASLVNGFAPSWVNTLMGIANRFLPSAATVNHQVREARDAESRFSRGPVSTLSDKAAAENNEN